MDNGDLVVFPFSKFTSTQNAPDYMKRVPTIVSVKPSM